MVEVSEIAVNLCLNHLVISDNETVFCDYYKFASEYIRKLGFFQPNRVYIGAEFCEKLLYNISHISFWNKLLHSNPCIEYVSFVIPPIRESFFEHLRVILNQITNYPYIDEIVFNDLGTMRYLHQNHPQYTLVAGRLLDKGMREARFDVFTDSIAVHENQRMMEGTNLSSAFYLKLFDDYNVNRVELDTLNGSVLHLASTSTVKYSVHYPRIFLSRSDYCEFGGIGRKLLEKFRISNSCSFMCGKIWEKLEDPTDSGIYKSGNAIFTSQNEDLSKCVDGTFRFVFSQGAENESCCSHSFL